MNTTFRPAHARTAVSAMALAPRMAYDGTINDALVIDPSSSPAIVAPFSTSESA
jgi:hypothetical protein